MATLDSTNLEDARDGPLSVVVQHFKPDPDVLGIFVGGSLAAGTADAFSDIDLRVVAHHECHSWFWGR